MLGFARPKLPIILCCLVLSGCSVATKTHTPFTFFWRDFSASDASGSPRTLNGASTAMLISELGLNPAHRFILETKGQGPVSNVQAYVTINGVEYPMLPSPAPIGTRLFTFVPQSECTPTSQYSHRVTFDAPLGGGNFRVPAGTGTYAVNVENFSKLVWYTGFATHESGSGEVGLSPDHPVGNVHFKNYLGADAKRRVESISIDPAFPDAAKFEIVSTPTLPAILDCGQELQFQVKWHSPAGAYNPANDYNDNANVLIHYAQPIDAVNWSPVATPFVVKLKTSPPAT